MQSILDRQADSEIQFAISFSSKVTGTISNPRVVVVDLGKPLLEYKPKLSIINPSSR